MVFLSPFLRLIPGILIFISKRQLLTAHGDGKQTADMLFLPRLTPTNSLSEMPGTLLPWIINCLVKILPLFLLHLFLEL